MAFQVELSLYRSIALWMFVSPPTIRPSSARPSARGERRRLETLAAVDKAEASLASGKCRTVTAREEARQLAEDVKRRGLARLEAQQLPSR
jgi:hypothetical protein